MFLINVHKSQLRKRKRSRQRKRRGTSVQSCSTRSGEESTASPRLEEEHEEERRNSFAEEEDEEDLLPALALINSQQALLELIERHSEEGVEGLADLENLPGIMEQALEPNIFNPYAFFFQSTFCWRSWSCLTTSPPATWWTTTSCSTSTSRT